MPFGIVVLLWFLKFICLLERLGNLLCIELKYVCLLLGCSRNKTICFILDQIKYLDQLECFV